MRETPRQRLALLRAEAAEARDRSTRLANQIANPANLASEKRNLMRSAEQAAALADELDQQADRAEALVRAKEMVPPLSVADGGDADDGASFGAIARGQLRHETTYRPDRAETSYVRDMLVTAQPGSFDPRAVYEANERLRRNQDEASAFLRISRDVSTGDPGAGALIPPVYLDREWTDAAVAGRPFADAVGRFP